MARRTLNVAQARRDVVPRLAPPPPPRSCPSKKYVRPTLLTALILGVEPGTALSAYTFRHSDGTTLNQRKKSKCPMSAAMSTSPRLMAGTSRSFGVPAETKTPPVGTTSTRILLIRQPMLPYPTSSKCIIMKS